MDSARSAASMECGGRVPIAEIGTATPLWMGEVRPGMIWQCWQGRSQFSGSYVDGVVGWLVSKAVSSRSVGTTALHKGLSLTRPQSSTRTVVSDLIRL